MSKDIILENPEGLINGDIIVDNNQIAGDITVDHNIIDGDITVDDNTIETPIIPERPNVVKHEQFELFAPLANYRHSGMASFDPNSFIVENGRVKNRTNLAKAITDFVIDQSGKTISLHFNDGSVKTTVIPDADFDRVTNALTLITISEDSWIEDVDGEDVYYYFVATSEVTGRNDSNYFVSLELSDNAYDPTVGMVKSGHFVMNESCFKASDGSLLICSNAPFTGRVLVMTSIFTNELLRNEKVADTEEGTIYNQVFKDGTTVQWLAPKGPEGTTVVCEEILRPDVNNIAVGYEGTVKASSISGVANVGDKMSAFIVTTAGFTYGAVIEITSDENNGIHSYVVKDLTLLHSDVDDGDGTLVSKYAITINKTYDTILERINNGLAVDALKPWVFNRVPMANEQVFAVCTTSDGQTIGCTLEILGVNDAGNYPFKIVALVVLYRAPLILLYTLWPNTNADNILNGYYGSAPLFAFNRTPYEGEVFSAMIKTSSGDAMTMTARISGYSEKDGVSYAEFYSIESTLLANDATTLTRTMRFGGVTPKIFTDVNDEDEYTFVGTRGHHAIGVELFTVTPRVGSVFFGTVVLKNNNSDNYSSIATFTAEVTGINTNDRNSVVEYKLIDATIFHDGDIDDKVNNFGGNVVKIGLSSGDVQDSIVQNYSDDLKDPEKPEEDFDNVNQGYGAAVFGQSNKNLQPENEDWGGPNRTIMAGKLNVNTTANSIVAGLMNKVVNSERDDDKDGKPDGSGQSNIVAGQENYVAGKYNIVAGYKNGGTDDEGNDKPFDTQNSIISGTGNKSSSGDAVIVSGDSNTVNGHRILVSGSNNIVSADDVVVSGQNNEVTHSSSIVAGIHNETSTDYQIIAGHYAKATPDALFVLGNGAPSNPNNPKDPVKPYRSNAFVVSRGGMIRAKGVDTGNDSFNIGTGNINNTTNSVVIGKDNQVQSGSRANSVVIGKSLFHYPADGMLGSMTVGRYNVKNTAESHNNYFVLGNGSSDTDRSNAVTIDRDHVRVHIAPSDEEDVVRLHELEAMNIKNGDGLHSLTIPFTFFEDGNPKEDYQSTASGYQAIAFGESNTNEGNRGIIVGKLNKQTETSHNGITGGLRNTDEGHHNIVGGQDNEIYSDPDNKKTSRANIVTGVDNTLEKRTIANNVSGSSNTVYEGVQGASVFGNDNVAAGNNSFVGGTGSLTSTSNTFAMGNNVRATNNGAAAFGYNNTASHKYTFVAGIHNITGNHYQSVFGTGNVGGDDNLFEVGYGKQALDENGKPKTDEDGNPVINRKNAFTIDEDGQVSVLLEPKKDEHVVRRSDLYSAVSSVTGNSNDDVTSITLYGIKNYASDQLDALKSKLDTVSNVMDFVGAMTSVPTGGDYRSGDVIVVTEGDDAGKEFVYDGVQWVEFGYSDALDAAIARLQEGKVDKVEGEDLIDTSEITRLAGMSDGANKVEPSETNGHIRIDGVETTVYDDGDCVKLSDVTGDDTNDEILTNIAAALVRFMPWYEGEVETT